MDSLRSYEGSSRSDVENKKYGLLMQTETESECDGTESMMSYSFDEESCLSKASKMRRSTWLKCGAVFGLAIT